MSFGIGFVMTKMSNFTFDAERRGKKERLKVRTL